jgi:release factor glutamine methyltransferase
MQVRDLRREFREIPTEDFSFLLSVILDGVTEGIPGQQELGPAQETCFRGFLQRAQAGEPPQYIVNKAWFYGLCLFVDERVLIPRFDTEVLVEALLENLPPNADVLEIGLGSGAISLALKSQMPGLKICATDISAKALQVAEINSQNLGLPLNLLCRDLYPEGAQRFDAIVSNPPYICIEEYQNLHSRVRDYEPRLALIAKDNGMEFYKRIIHRASRYLKDGGVLAFEHGYNQQSALRSLTESAGFETLQTGKDLGGKDRFLICKFNKKRMKWINL